MAARQIAKFGETVTYRNAEGEESSIKAIIDRDGLEPQQDGKRTLASSMVVYVLRSDLSSIDTENDTIQLEDYDGTTQWKPVAAILDSDDGVWALVVGR